MDPKAHITNSERDPERSSSVANQNSFAASVHIPDHELLRCIGRGSYGEVWLARNQMGVYRAVKIVHRASFADGGPFQRELTGIRTFEPVSRSHEGFVDVLHVGINEGAGYFYYVMELGDDEETGASIAPDTYSPKTLAKELAHHGRMPVRACVGLGLVLTQALAELHRNSLVHRDIKPSNIIFVNGVPKLADIGLVAQIEEARTYVGTAGFIPPEGPGRAAADIYALGKVLYEASTGLDRQNFPALPADCETFGDRPEFFELNEIIVHACQNELPQRYATAEDMHADLVALTNGKSIRRLHLLERRMARLKRVAVLLALWAVILSGLLYPLYGHWRRKIEARERQIVSDIAYGSRSIDTGEYLGALPYFADALRLDQGNDHREWGHRLRVGSVLAQCPKLTRIWSLPTRANSVELSPDGTHVLVCLFENCVEIYDLRTGELYKQAFAKGRFVTSASYSPDGRRIVIASQGFDSAIWDATTLNDPIRLQHPAPAFSAKFSPDGRHVVTGCQGGVVQVWDAATGRLETNLEKHTGGVRCVAFSHNGRWLATGSEDGTVELWDALTWRCLDRSLKHPSWVNGIAFSPDDKKLVTACADRNARVWEMPTGRRILPDLEHDDVAKVCQFTPDGQLIITASFDGTARLWRSAGLRPNGATAVLRLGEPVTDIACSADGRLILTASTDGSVRVWDLAGCTVSPLQLNGTFSGDGTRFATLTNNALSVWSTTPTTLISSCTLAVPADKVVLNQNGTFFLTISTNANNAGAVCCNISAFSAATGRQMGHVAQLTNAPVGVVLTADGSRFVAYWTNLAQVWSVADARPTCPLLDNQARVNRIALSRDGARLATVGDNLVRIWDTATGVAVCPPLEHDRPVADAEFSPQGSLLVSACSDEKVNKCAAQIWDAATGRRLGKPLAHRDGVKKAVFSADSRRIATASEDFTAIVWDARTGKQIGQVLHHKHQVHGVSFSPDGDYIVTGSQDKSARVWSADSGDPLTPPLLHLAIVENAVFLPDGKKVLTLDQLGSSWLWDLPVDDRPVDDLMLLSYLLSGGTATPSSGWAPPHGASLQAIWEELNSKYPLEFSTSPEEVTTWHEFETQLAKQQRNWSAVAFHLRYLLQDRPGDSSLAAQLAEANKHLQAGE